MVQARAARLAGAGFRALAPNVKPEPRGVNTGRAASRVVRAAVRPGGEASAPPLMRSGDDLFPAAERGSAKIREWASLYA